MSRWSARSHLLGLIAAALLPVWLFAAYLLSQYAFNERDRFERAALQVARQASLVVEGELNNLLTVVRGLSTSAALAQSDFRTLHAEAERLVRGTDRVILLRDYGRRQILNTAVPFGSDLPPAVELTATDRANLDAGRHVIGDVYAAPISGEYRIPVAIPVRGPNAEQWLLAITVPTAAIRDAIVPATPAGWTLGVGDRDGTYVARSQLHEATTGKPGLPEYLKLVVGGSGTFTSRNFQGMTLLAGYYRSPFSDWFYTANVPLSVVQAPLWGSVVAIASIGLVAMLMSVALAYVVGKGFARAAGDLAARAHALGHGRPVEHMETTVAEFAVIADALKTAEHALGERASQLQAVLETAPAAVWFTYDPQGRRVIRNRFAAELMGLPSDNRKSFGSPDMVIDTIALKDGRTISREDRPLTRAMRGEHTENEEFAYILPSGVQRILLSSARPIIDKEDSIIGAVQISLDITERKRGEEQRKLLVNELNHRVKNTLAVVQSIAGQTLRTAPSLEAAGRSLGSRLIALAKAHDILTREHWSGANLSELIVASVSQHAEIRRFNLSGGTVWLPPPLALSLALAFHELTTNAVKYGALSTAEGSIDIGWSLAGEGSRTLRIEWRERDGPVVPPVERRGFGTRMIEKILDAESGGAVSISFAESGVVCVMETDLGAAAPERRPGVTAMGRPANRDART